MIRPHGAPLLGCSAKEGSETPGYTRPAIRCNGLTTNHRQELIMPATATTTRPTSTDLLDAALADLECATSAAIAHNSARMSHPLIRGWLTEGGAEPVDRIVGLVSTAPAARIHLALRRGEVVSIADASKAIATMQRGVARALRREKERAAVGLVA